MFIGFGSIKRNGGNYGQYQSITVRKKTLEERVQALEERGECKMAYVPKIFVDRSTEFPSEEH